MIQTCGEHILKRTRPWILRCLSIRFVNVYDMDMQAKTIPIVDGEGSAIHLSRLQDMSY